MQRTRNILFNSCFAFNALLVFMLIFEQQLSIPAWLQVAGRAHPLVLHFPITLLVLYIGWTLFFEKKVQDDNAVGFGDVLLLLSAVSASITALMGMILSREAGYDPETLQWHKWTGIAVALLTSVWYYFRKTINSRNWLHWSAAIATLFIIVFTGHEGADITHGDNFLFAPVEKEKQEPIVPIEEALVFENLVKPILDKKCLSCHNSKKAKGELIMETAEDLLKGGKNGKLWDSAEANYGLLLQRVHLPLEEKKHMPPSGKTQLTDDELLVLQFWIRQGASFTKKVLDLLPADSLRQLAEKKFSARPAEKFDFAAASESTIKSLTNSNRVVFPMAMESPGLVVNFYNSQYYTAKALEELNTVKEQVVELDLSRMPVKDEELKTIAQFAHLQKLNLNFTSITGSTLNELQELKNLKYLSVAGTKINKQQLASLEKISSLQRAIVWNTAISPDELEQLKNKKGGIVYEVGFSGDTLMMQLTAPIIQNEEKVITGAVPLRMKHYINGTIIRYTTDGTDPDSITSKIYDDKAVIEGNTTIKAKAFKKGWISSEISQQFFYSNTYTPDSGKFLLPPDPKFTGEGVKTLFNAQMGDFNFGSGQWLGYRQNKMETLLFFKKPVEAKSITTSFLSLIGSYIMPPVSVEVWGGSDAQHLVLLGKVSPVQPTKMEGGTIIPVDVKFTKQPLSCVKIIAVPVPKLPAWHPGKGEKGWVFADEVFVN